MTDFAPNQCFGMFPQWVPKAAQHYVFHTEAGRSIRSLALRAGCHASTVLRQVRRLEARRDDLLVDEALTRLASQWDTPAHFKKIANRDSTNMTKHLRQATTTPDDATVEREARRILRRLCEPQACLAVAKDMEKSVVVREGAEGRTTRTAVVDRPIAQAMALKDWISCDNPGWISRYRITGVGRTALKRLLSQEDATRVGFAEASGRFGGKIGRVEDDTVVAQSSRYSCAESPVAALARRIDRDGQPFLNANLVSAAEKLREDFEVAQMGVRVTQDWDRFLSDENQDNVNCGGDGASAARARVAKALRALGPGLGDVVLRVCCHLEGLETAEKRMGWSARSGKIVLRIALLRLKQHYDEDRESAMIG